MTDIDLKAILDALAGLLDAVGETAGMPVGSLSGREHVAARGAISLLDDAIIEGTKRRQENEAAIAFAAAREAVAHTGKEWWQLDVGQRAYWIGEATRQMEEWNAEVGFHESRKKVSGRAAVSLPGNDV